MPRDELRQPLRRRSLKERLWAKRPSTLSITAVSLVAIIAGGGLWLSRIPRPFAGEPIVLAAVPPLKELTTASTEPSATPPAPAGEDAAPPENPEDVMADNAGLAGEQEVVTPPQDPYPEEAAIIVAPNRPLKPAPIAAVTEESEQGPLPRIAKNGKKPFDAYSQVTPMAVTISARPKITILLGGMGLNARLTDKAIKELPGDISFGFAPYGEDLQAQVNRARAKGHEIMLQVPMEPVGYPGNNPGPKTLLTEASPEQNTEALLWHMSRFAGYSGITNYMGARLLVSEEALAPVMKEMKKRGLVYLEDATVNLTLSPRIGQQNRLPVRRASLAIDADPTPAAIADALERLEQEAAANGSAIGTGSVLEATVDTVAEWAKGLKDKGILLVPVSAAFKGRAS